MSTPSLVIAVPSKGRLKEKAAALFEAAGYTLRVRGHERGYRGQLDGLPDVCLLYTSDAADDYFWV